MNLQGKSMAKKQIMVVEDELKIARIVGDYLESSGYQAVLISHGNDVISQVHKSRPDLIILDIMLPGKDGIELCKEIRRFSDVPIIMLTAKVEEIDRLLGLELGADDYICKPFSPREVVARVKTILKRVAPQTTPKMLSCGKINLDPVCHQVFIMNAEVQLTPIEFGLLQFLMTNSGQVFSRNELIDNVQGYSSEGYDRTIDSHIKNLRKKIAQQLPENKYIRTVYGVGYTFNPEPPSD